MAGWYLQDVGGALAPERAQDQPPGAGPGGGADGLLAGALHALVGVVLPGEDLAVGVVPAGRQRWLRGAEQQGQPPPLSADVLRAWPRPPHLPCSPRCPAPGLREGRSQAWLRGRPAEGCGWGPVPRGPWLHPSAAPGCRVRTVGMGPQVRGSSHAAGDTGPTKPTRPRSPALLPASPVRAPHPRASRALVPRSARQLVQLQLLPAWSRAPCTPSPSAASLALIGDERGLFPSAPHRAAAWLVAPGGRGRRWGGQQQLARAAGAGCRRQCPGLRRQPGPGQGSAACGPALFPPTQGAGWPQAPPAPFPLPPITEGSVICCFV